MPGEGFAPPKAYAGSFTDFSGWLLRQPGLRIPFFELEVGVEPTTYCLQNSCSATELLQQDKNILS